MDETPIICKATRDTFVRFAVVLAAVLGFGLYFFYDAATGYRQANAAILSYNAFARLGELASKATATEWNALMLEDRLIPTAEGRPDAAEGEKGALYPLPRGLEATQAYPAEARGHAAMAAGWGDCWTAYSARMHYPLKPGDHPHDEGAIREQWYGGAACMLASALILFFIVRTARREMSIRGSRVCAAGQRFDVADIERIDLRQWGPGFKGAAYFTVKGRRLKADGMTYGGFSKAQGEPAERFMKAVLARYRGDIIDYEQEPAGQ